MENDEIPKTIMKMHNKIIPVLKAYMYLYIVVGNLKKMTVRKKLLA